MACMLIFKIFRRAEWEAFVAAGQTAGAPVDVADGFIHFSTAAQVVETIQQTGSTNSIGDGKIFVFDLASAIRIRTGETGDTAL